MSTPTDGRETAASSQQAANSNAPPQAGTAARVLDTLVPTNPLAAVSCWTGILSIILCGTGVVLGPVALATGVVSLKRGALITQSGYGKATSTARSWIGIVTGIIGTVVGVAFVIFMVMQPARR